jgi:hypothetical protein
VTGKSSTYKSFLDLCLSSRSAEAGDKPSAPKVRKRFRDKADGQASHQPRKCASGFGIKLMARQTIGLTRLMELNKDGH